ncbi:50S ribosomal protein L2 [Candidatus Roizmanbacteria bacterium RIFCSPHIGHO2_02_FULL_37_13b]|uniref:Large ribosomal subunit protein uL2 n=1 Tax=Candidatus Roizmanbacteria bacterium RIFCSPLOWO2_02_FULL_36_11 TaxID=1802071 RepID=A0A1F7JCJ4_9BACT|nr:MAG: 50S ribosomal protein L2 [Candidatus Roizmanbacteria bacterium RIFCSPHIGHO2_02_FULL_37_13b]OGK53332.1 MAG: 50S ribosomal protein L2 [Candidatus Roizmanbacteria bacterium RIFCSPLOWO2_02_FULL_36_11]
MNKSTNVPKTLNPEKVLTRILKKRSGRDNSGQISVRHQGGRQKRYYRFIDSSRDKKDMEAKIIGVEYDPNRTANISLVEYKDGVRKYILHVEGQMIGDKIISSSIVEVKIGNAMFLKNIPLGTQIHNVELYPGQGGALIKSAGSSGVVIAKDEKYADIKLPSKEVRKILLTCMATIGQISNVAHKLEKIGKAGRNRLKGIRPTVRGVAQNPRSHSHGGGEGRSGIGMHPKTPWGKSAMGTRTRNKKKWSNKLIVKRRN